MGNEGGEAGSACVPRTCVASGVVCGVLDDGCGEQCSVFLLEQVIHDPAPLR